MARDLGPTLRRRAASPRTRRLFQNVGPLIKASETGLPALRDTLAELQPVTRRWTPSSPTSTRSSATWTSAPPASPTSSPTLPPRRPGLPPIPGQTSPRHISRQLGIISPETLSIHQQRLPTNRGNGYIQPFGIGNPFSASQNELFPSHDCDNTTASGGSGSGRSR